MMRVWCFLLLLLALLAVIATGAPRRTATEAFEAAPSPEERLQQTCGIAHRSFVYYLDMAMHERLHRASDVLSQQLFLDRFLREPPSKDAWHGRLTRVVDDFVGSVEQARTQCRKRRIVFCGLMRQAAHLVSAVRTRVETLGALFADYHVVIVENNSTDGTRAQLLAWAAADHDHITVLCDSEFMTNQPECQLDGILARSDDPTHKSNEVTRIRKMSMLRNLYVRYIRRHFAQWDYAMVLDLDLQGTLFVDSVLHAVHTLSDNDDVDVVAANGQLWNPLLGRYGYYDSFAFVGHDQGRTYWTDGGEKQLHDWYVHDRITARLQHQHDPLPVRSAFGGCALYRMHSFLRGAYGHARDKQLCCEHSFFHQKMNVLIDPHFVFLIDINQ